MTVRVLIDSSYSFYTVMNVFIFIFIRLKSFMNLLMDYAEKSWFFYCRLTDYWLLTVNVSGMVGGFF